MYALNAGFTRKMKKGRPCVYKPIERSYIETKKQELFERYEMQKEAMNVISLAYHFGKLTKEEYDVACFLEHLFIKSQKGMGIKKLPSSSPNTWTIHVQNSWNTITYGNEDLKAQNCWRRVKDFVTSSNPRIAQEFFNIITLHYSYEDLQAVKYNGQSTTDILKEGLNIVQRMFTLGYL